MDFNVEPYQKGDGKIQNTPSENDGRQPYKQTSQIELWTFVRLADIVGTYLYPAITKICAYSN